MPPNSIALDFQKMPTVTVDGKTQKFKAENGGYQPITEGGVTYSLVKPKESGRFTMTMRGEPTSLEKFNFSVGKGRVTDGTFAGDSMNSFFKGTVSLGEKKNAEKDYFRNFSIAGGHLADRTAFLQSGAWGLDQSSAEKELNRLEEEAEAAAKKADTKPEPKKDSEIPEKSGDEPPVEVYEYVPQWERNSSQPGDPPTNEYQLQSEPPDPRIYNYDPTAAIAKARAAQAQPLSGTLTVSQIVPFDADGIQKRANTEWTDLSTRQKLTGNQAYLNNYQHVAVEGKGYCALTAMATYHGMKTSELINHLRGVAQQLNKGEVVDEMLKTMASNSSGFDPGKESYQEVFQEAGLSFRVINLGSIDTPSYVGKFPDDNEQVPALLFTKQTNSAEGHFDLLAPRGHLANQVALPTDANSYVMNDYKRN
jgi:hypothetical protein